MCRVKVLTTIMRYKVANEDTVETKELVLMGAYRSKRYRIKAARRALENSNPKLTFIGEVDHVIKESMYRLSRADIIEHGEKISEKEIH